MGVVIPFNGKVVKTDKVEEVEEFDVDAFIEGVQYDNPPTSAPEFQARVKEILETDEYEDFLLAIMDIEYYDALEDDIKALVDTFYDYLEGQ